MDWIVLKRACELVGKNNVWSMYKLGITMKHSPLVSSALKFVKGYFEDVVKDCSMDCLFAEDLWPILMAKYGFTECQKWRLVLKWALNDNL